MIGAGEDLFADVYLDPKNPPEQIMLQWNDGSWNHRAYWGANSIGWGVDGTISRRHMGRLPPAGQWVRLIVPARAVGLEETSAHGMAFSLYGGRAIWAKAGKRPGRSEVVWVDDRVPVGATLFGDNGDGWYWFEREAKRSAATGDAWVPKHPDGIHRSPNLGI